MVDLDELVVKARVLLLLVAFLLVLLGVERGVLDDLRQDLGGDVRQGDRGVRAGICRGRTRKDAWVSSVHNESKRRFGRDRHASQERPGGGKTGGDVPSIMFLMVSDLLLLDCEDGDGARWEEGSAASLETISAETSSQVHVRDAYSQSNLLLHLEALSVGGHQSDGPVVSHLAVFSKYVDLGRVGFPGEHHSGRRRGRRNTRGTLVCVTQVGRGRTAGRERL